MMRSPGSCRCTFLPVTLVATDCVYRTNHRQASLSGGRTAHVYVYQPCLVCCAVRPFAREPNVCSLLGARVVVIMLMVKCGPDGFDKTAVQQYMAAEFELLADHDLDLMDYIDHIDHLEPVFPVMESLNCW